MKRLLNLIKLPTTRDVIINTVGNYLSIFFTALYALILVRILNPTEYGVLSVLFAIAYLLASILDFGVTASIYSYLPPILVDRSETYQFIKSNFIFQTILSSLVLIIAFIFIQPIDKNILKLHVPLSYYFWTFVSIPLFIWQNFTLNVLFAAKKFLYANVLNNIAFVLKTIFLFGLILTNNVTIINVIVSFGVVGQLVFFAVLFGHKRQPIINILKTKLNRDHIKLNYTLTFFAATQLFNIASRVDLFMLSFFLHKSEVGYYGLSQKIILTVITMINAITQVLSPNFAKIDKKSEAVSLLKKGFIYMIIPIAVFIFAIMIPTQIYTLVFTNQFEKSAAITRLLSASFILYGINAIPALFFLYTVKKPIHLLLMNVLFLFLVFVGCFIFIQKWGVFGPPLAFIAAFFAVALYSLLAFKKEFARLK